MTKSLNSDWVVELSESIERIVSASLNYQETRAMRVQYAAVQIMDADKWYHPAEIEAHLKVHPYSWET